MGGAEDGLGHCCLGAFGVDDATIKYSSSHLSIPKGSIYWPFEIEIHKPAAGPQDDCFYALELAQGYNHNIYYGKSGHDRCSIPTEPAYNRTMIEDSLAKAAMGSGVAIYAAIISTLALVISVVTATVQVRKALSEGVILNLSAIANAIELTGSEGSFIYLTVTNRGTAATTLTNMLLYNYETDEAIKRGRPDLTAVVNSPNIPHVLKPGELWNGRVAHDRQIRSMLEVGRLHVGVISSHREREFLLRLRPRRAPAADPWDWIRRPVGTPPKASQ